MRESIGGAWLTGIVVTFLALFAAFLVYAVNYTKAFRVKDRIISIIEEHEGYTVSKKQDIKNLSDDELLSDGSAEAEIFYFINKIGYNYEAVSGCAENNSLDTGSYGFCLEKHCVKIGDNNYANRVYYKVTSYIALRIPVVNISISIPISGETTTMYFDSTGMEGASSNCYVDF